MPRRLSQLQARRSTRPGEQGGLFSIAMSLAHAPHANSIDPPLIECHNFSTSEAKSGSDTRKRRAELTTEASTLGHDLTIFRAQP
jgi:hypothetical protein